MNKNKIFFLAIALATAASLASVIPVSADTTTAVQPNTTWGGYTGQMQGHGMNRQRPAVFGTVSAISGNTLTVTERQGLGRPIEAPENDSGGSGSIAAPLSATPFSVDATNATITKNNATSSVSSIAIGDMVIVQGTVNGTNIVATSIYDGIMRGGMGKVGPPDRFEGQASSSLPILGNGQPVVAGTVSAVNGSTFTITNKSGAVYTIDATNAKIVQGRNTISLGSVNVGDTVIVQGAVNGTSIVASSVVDQARPSGSGSEASGEGSGHKNFFGGIGQFFMHLFGF